MSLPMNTTIMFEELNKLLLEVFKEHEAQEVETYTKVQILKNILRRRHYWPYIQVKPFFDRSGLVLMHNTYKRVGVEHFQKLYDECRSVVLNLDAPIGENVVLSLSNVIPTSMTTEQYKASIEENDICERSYEGTTITVYYHGDKWYFGTTSCPTMDSSRYFTKNMTHGDMFDAVLKDYYGEEESLRKRFTDVLDMTKVYTFILVHHLNRHLSTVDSDEFKGLFHIATRDRVTMVDENIRDVPLPNVSFVERFESPEVAIEWLVENEKSYGFIVKRGTQLLKVSPEAIVRRDEETLGHPNIWHNMLWVYMQQNKEFMIQDYVRKYAPDMVYPKDSNGRDLAPTYIIHTVICTMRDVLLQLYTDTTAYDPDVRRYTVNKEWDNLLAPIMRFHLAQLRNIQIHHQKHTFMNMRTVYHYLCHHQTLKNMRMIIHFFATSGSFYNIPARAMECFYTLDQALIE